MLHYFNLHVILFFIPTIFAIASGVSPTNLFPDHEWEANRITISNTKSLFYYLLKCPNNSTAPLVLFFAGGPGGSGSTALFLENGPHLFNSSYALSKNVFSWTNVADVLYLDNPVGVCYSKATELCKTDYCTSHDMYVFLLKFLNNHPEYIKRPIYLTGESYGAHFVTSFAHLLLERKNEDINLKGCGIGSGLIDAYGQLPTYPGFLYENKNISFGLYLFMEGFVRMCAIIKKVAEIDSINYICSRGMFYMGAIAKVDYNDITTNYSDPEYGRRFFELMNRTDVRKSFSIPENEYYSVANPLVSIALRNDWSLSYRPKLADILLHKDIKVVLWYGDKDFICNWRGGLLAVDSIPWPKQNEFKQLELRKWQDNMGEVKHLENLNFYKIYNAGHSIFLRQKKAGLELLKELLKQ